MNEQDLKWKKEKGSKGKVTQKEKTKEKVQRQCRCGGIRRIEIVGEKEIKARWKEDKVQMRVVMERKAVPERQDQRMMGNTDDAKKRIR